jgi:hypothetical protein
MDLRIGIFDFGFVCLGALLRVMDAGFVSSPGFCAVATLSLAMTQFNVLVCVCWVMALNARVSEERNKSLGFLLGVFCFELLAAGFHFIY